MLHRFLITSALVFFTSTLSAAELKLGVATDLTGPNASQGISVRVGVEQAVAAINEKGGVLGEKIIVVPGDDRSDPKEAVSVAQKMISEEIKFVVGHLTSSASMATSKEYAEGGTLLISPSATNVDFTDKGQWNTLRTAGRNDQQGQTAGTYLLTHFKNKKIAIIHDKAAYGKPLADDTRKAFNAGGGKEVLYDGINPGEKDYSSLVSRLKSLNVDVIFYGGYYAEAGLLIRQLRDQGMKNTLVMGGDGLFNTELGQIAGEGVVGTLFTYNADPEKNPAAENVVAALNAKKIDTSAFMLPSYAAVQVLAQAAETAKSLDPKKVAETIRSGKSFDTVMGPISFNAKGDLTKANFVIYEWKKDSSGKLIYAEKPEASQ